MALSKTNKMRLFQKITDWSTDKMRANKKAIHDIVCDGNAITYDEQNLTEEQQAQARENIGIESMTAQEVATAVDTAWTNAMGT